MPAVPELRSLRQEEPEFKASLSTLHMVPCFKSQKEELEVLLLINGVQH
jgi:hypothetical protein